jgi:magnesium transporter
MVTIYVHEGGTTRQETAFDRAWLDPGSPAKLWVDFAAPSSEELALLATGFGFHPLAVEDAVASAHHPKIEAYDGYLYLILHGIDYRKSQEAFATHDTDFFLGRNYLVTVHDGQTRSVASVSDLCQRNDLILAEGPGALMHRIIDRMVDNYRPEVDELEDWLDELERDVFDNPRSDLPREILEAKSDIRSLRRIALPQRDAVGRLARREFPLISDELAYRFRDVYDNLVRISDESLLFQDRITSLLDVHLSNTSNRLNQIMKVLTVITVIFMPLTLVAGLYGMNMRLPLVANDHDPRPFWWLGGAMFVAVVAMLAYFRRKKWL